MSVVVGAGRDSPARPRIIPIPRRHVDEAAEVLALAFERDPLMCYLFPSGASERAVGPQLRELFQCTCACQLDVGWPLLGCEVGGQLVGVACVEEPDDGRPWPEEATKRYERLTSALGPEATSRLESYSDWREQHRPLRPDLYLIVLGVHPAAQRQGYGRGLLDAIQALSEAHPASTGVALDTENAANVAIYQRCGYGVVDQGRLGDLDVWCMFRPNRARRGVRGQQLLQLAGAVPLNDVQLMRQAIDETRQQVGAEPPYPLEKGNGRSVAMRRPNPWTRSLWSGLGSWAQGSGFTVPPRASRSD